nr:hypothetical protein [Mesorhizobium sp.]
MTEKTEQLDLFKCVPRQPPAVVISALPYIARRIWRERMLSLPNTPGEVVSLEVTRKRA